MQCQRIVGRLARGLGEALFLVGPLHWACLVSWAGEESRCKMAEAVWQLCCHIAGSLAVGKRCFKGKALTMQAC